jgi:hypothetical protein
MKFRFLVPVAVLAVTVSLEAQKAPAPAAGPAVKSAAAAPRASTTPKTPWGDPDLQGTWTAMIASAHR